MRSFYDPTSFQTLVDWVSEGGGELVSSRQVAFVGSNSTYTDRLYRQHVTATNSGSLVVASALKNPGGEPLFKIYWKTLRPFGPVILVEELDRRREGHYVHSSDVGSYPWLLTSSLSTY